VADISLILFDLNGVLYAYDRAARIAHLAQSCGQSPDAVRAAIWDSGFEDSGDAGILDADTYLRDFATHLGRLTEADWIEAQRQAATPIPATLALLRRLKPTVQTAVLTNNNLLVHRHFATLYPDLANTPAHVSASFGARKPDPAVYQRCLAAIGAAPERTIFIDDSAANVEGARKAGLLGYHFTAAGPLADWLAGMGLLEGKP